MPWEEHFAIIHAHQLVLLPLAVASKTIWMEKRS